MFAAAKSGSSTLLIIYVVVFAALYFFYLRPRSRKQKAQRAEARNVEVGQKAQTIGGIIGTIVARDAEKVTMRTASGVEIDFVPSAIARRIDTVAPSASEPKTEGSAE